jgi:beta-galactosidase
MDRLNRREFLKTSGSVVAVSALAATPGLAAPVEARGRSVYPINRNWRFHPAKVEAAVGVEFDDSAFTRVVIPHTNCALPWHSVEEQDYEFISTYRRRFKLPASAAGKRVFVDFEGAMTASTVWINGVSLGEYRGGFTPFSFELTQHVHLDKENVLVVFLDSTEREDIPPFGGEIDYLTFGGIYREVALRVVPQMYLDNIFARPKDVLSASPGLEVDCFLAGGTGEGVSLEVELREGERLVAKGTQELTMRQTQATPLPVEPGEPGSAVASAETVSDPARHTVSLSNLTGIKLWDLDQPQLYEVVVRLLRAGQVVDEDRRRIGFREAMFTPQGFSLNGKVVKLRGLDRHQLFPFVGQAMPARVQRQDAKILRKGLHCNIVRTSHYPQSRHFLDACDEMGLLVLEEIPGWQHIGNEAWKTLAVDNVGRMIRRDWNHPSVILWGVRINESRNDHDFYVRTNARAHELDATRQTGGIRTPSGTELLEDVYTINDFGFPLQPPNHPLYLNTEFVGHTYPTKSTDDDERQREHTLRHARIHNQLASNPQYAGGLGWCAFDYNTHANFGAGDRICYHGVTDIFREPKPAAGFYKSQCDPAEEIVLEPAFHWANSDESTHFTVAVICSNCDHLKIYNRAYTMKTNEKLDDNPWELRVELDPNHTDFPHLQYAPFQFDLTKVRAKWGDMRIDGYLKGEKVISKTFSGRGVDRRFTAVADDAELMADGADTTRVVFRVTDEFGAIRPYANDPVVMTLEGPAALIGDNPFGLIGGTGAVWIRASEKAGVVTLMAKHPRLGTQVVKVTLRGVAAETV